MNGGKKDENQKKILKKENTREEKLNTRISLNIIIKLLNRKTRENGLNIQSHTHATTHTTFTTENKNTKKQTKH